MVKRKGNRPQVTMRDVARAAGVSRMTVSRAMRKDSPINKETREHVLKIVKELNYVPDQLAGSLKDKKSGFVAVLLPSLNNLHFAQTVQSLTEELEKIDLQLLLGHTDYSREREEQLVEMMLRRRPEAIVLSFDGHTARTLELLDDAAIPVIEIWESPEHPIEHTVGFSNRAATYEMTQQLIARGLKRIVFLSEKDDDWTRGAARRAGFQQAMRDHGLDGTASVRFGAPPLTIENGAAAADQVLAQFPDVECVFCVSDIAAFGVQSRLLELGTSVPGQIAVVGFGNFEVSRFSSPTITTVVVDPAGIGREAGRLIARLRADSESDDESPEHISVPTHPEFRQSCP